MKVQLLTAGGGWQEIEDVMDMTVIDRCDKNNPLVVVRDQAYCIDKFRENKLKLFAGQGATHLSADILYEGMKREVT